MKLRIKKEHLGKRVGNGNDIYNLTADLSQKQLTFIKRMVADDFVEEYDELLEARKEVEDYSKDGVFRIHKDKNNVLSSKPKKKKKK